jgi:hypothetical protein
MTKKERAANMKQHSTEYLRTILPKGGTVTVKWLRRAPSGNSLYAVLAIDNGRIREISGNVSHVTGFKWANPNGGIWAYDFNNVNEALGRELHGDDRALSVVSI